jgi:hypothetical protein
MHQGKCPELILFFERIGPLVIALRPDNVPVGHQWPPTPTSIELIAASYVPTPAGSSGVRLFNLSPVRQIVIASSGLLADSLSLCLSVSLSPPPPPHPRVRASLRVRLLVLS